MRRAVVQVPGGPSQIQNNFIFSKGYSIRSLKFIQSFSKPPSSSTEPIMITAYVTLLYYHYYQRHFNCQKLQFGNCYVIMFLQCTIICIICVLYLFWLWKRQPEDKSFNHIATDMGLVCKKQDKKTLELLLEYLIVHKKWDKNPLAL